MKTIGISPKAVLAALFPLIAAGATTVVNWIATGVFDATEIKLAVAGVVASLLALFGAALGRPGNVVKVNEFASDDLLLAATERYT